MFVFFFFIWSPRETTIAKKTKTRWKMETDDDAALKTGGKDQN